MDDGIFSNIIPTTAEIHIWLHLTQGADISYKVSSLESLLAREISAGTGVHHYGSIP